MIWQTYVPKDIELQYLYSAAADAPNCITQSDFHEKRPFFFHAVALFPSLACVLFIFWQEAQFNKR